jgi:hypothetical protein
MPVRQDNSRRGLLFTVLLVIHFISFKGNISPLCYDLKQLKLKKQKAMYYFCWNFVRRLNQFLFQQDAYRDY